MSRWLTLSVFSCWSFVFFYFSVCYCLLYVLFLLFNFMIFIVCVVFLTSVSFNFLMFTLFFLFFSLFLLTRGGSNPEVPLQKKLLMTFWVARKSDDLYPLCCQHARNLGGTAVHVKLTVVCWAFDQREKVVLLLMDCSCLYVSPVAKGPSSKCRLRIAVDKDTLEIRDYSAFGRSLKCNI